MLKMTRSGMVFSGSEADIERARSDFEQQDWVRLPAILDRELWNMIQEQLAASSLEGKTASIYPPFNVSDSAIVLLLNNTQLFKIIERITGCGHIGWLRGRIYRIVPGASHYPDP